MKTEEVYPHRALIFLVAFLCVAFKILIIIGVISLIWTKD